MLSRSREIRWDAALRLALSEFCVIRSPISAGFAAGTEEIKRCQRGSLIDSVRPCAGRAGRAGRAGAFSVCGSLPLARGPPFVRSLRCNTLWKQAAVAVLETAQCGTRVGNTTHWLPVERRVGEKIRVSKELCIPRYSNARHLSIQRVSPSSLHASFLATLVETRTSTILSVHFLAARPLLHPPLRVPFLPFPRSLYRFDHSPCRLPAAEPSLLFLRSFRLYFPSPLA